MFFKERYFGYDDAIYASLRLLEILAHSGKPLSRLLADLPHERIDSGDSRRLPGRKKIYDCSKRRRNISASITMSSMSTACACDFPTAGD